MDSVYEQLANTSNRLLDKMVSNPDLSNIFMGLLSRCIMISTVERGVPFESIAFGPLATEENHEELILRCRVKFGADGARKSFFPSTTDFATYVRAKAHGLGLALSENPRFTAVFQDILERCDNYAAAKGIPFSHLKARRHFISNPGDMLILKVGKDVNTDPRKLN